MQALCSRYVNGPVRMRTGPSLESTRQPLSLPSVTRPWLGLPQAGVKDLTASVVSPFGTDVFKCHVHSWCRILLRPRERNYSRFAYSGAKALRSLPVWRGAVPTSSAAFTRPSRAHACACSPPSIRGVLIPHCARVHTEHSLAGYTGPNGALPYPPFHGVLLRPPPHRGTRPV